MALSLLKPNFKLDDNDYKKILEEFKRKFTKTDLIIFKNMLKKLTSI